MADNHDIPAYPLMFDPSQFANKYSPFAGKAIPFPAQYRGPPTDALGRPIQSYTDTQAQHDAWTPPPVAQAAQIPGTTLYSSPSGNPFAGVQIPQGQNSAVYQPRGGLTPDAWQALTPAQRNAAAGPMAQVSAGSAMMPSGNNFVASGSNPSGSNPTASMGLALQNAGASNFDQMAGQGRQQASAAAPTNPYDMNQAYLDALANPGKVTTPGATVAQSAPPSNQSGVLQQFLANWKNQGSPTQGAGNYNNAVVFNALQGMV